MDHPKDHSVFGLGLPGHTKGNTNSNFAMAPASHSWPRLKPHRHACRLDSPWVENHRKLESGNTGFQM